MEDGMISSGRGVRAEEEVFVAAGY